MPRRVPKLTKIGNLIGYKPTLGLNEILDRVIEDQRAALPAFSSARNDSPAGKQR
jgi:hypothetical protein